MLAVVTVLSRPEEVVSKIEEGGGERCWSGNQGRWSWRTKGHRLRVAWVRTVSHPRHLLAPSLNMLPQKAFKLAAVPGGKRSTANTPTRASGYSAPTGTPHHPGLPGRRSPAASPALGFGQNCSQRRCKCLWRQKEFRGNSVPAFPVPFTGCLELGRVVLPLRALCVSLCNADPVFIAPMDLTSLRWVKNFFF